MMKNLLRPICWIRGHSWYNYTRSDGSFRHGDCGRCGKKGNWTEEDENSKEFFPLKFKMHDGKIIDARMSKKEIDEILNKHREPTPLDDIDWESL